MPGDYFFRAGDRTNGCTIGFPGTSDGEISTFISDTPSISVNNTDVVVNTITLHPGACATILGEDSSGSYTLPHRGFDFETRMFTDNPADADLFIDIVYSTPVTDSSDCSSFTLSTIGGNLLIIETNPQPDIFTAFRSLRTIPVSGFTSSSNFDTTNFQSILFIVKTINGNHVKVVTNSWGFRNADGFIGCNVGLMWQLQPDRALSFDY
ncbi:hypothetical protein JYT87_03035 [Nitrospira defluvii]|nr:hypothetical protein [Nitrospira defluvii]